MKSVLAIVVALAAVAPGPSVAADVKALYPTPAGSLFVIDENFRLQWCALSACTIARRFDNKLPLTVIEVAPRVGSDDNDAWVIATDETLWLCVRENCYPMGFTDP